MTKFAVVIDTGNAAFEDAPEHELARLLRDAANRVEAGFYGAQGQMHILKDINGNTVGHFTTVEC